MGGVKECWLSCNQVLIALWTGLFYKVISTLLQAEVLGLCKDADFIWYTVLYYRYSQCECVAPLIMFQGIVFYYKKQRIEYLDNQIEMQKKEK